MEIPKWLKTRYRLKKEVKRRFIAAMKEEIQKQIEEDENRMLYGDPNGIKSSGVIYVNKQQEDTDGKVKRIIE